MELKKFFNFAFLQLIAAFLLTLEIFQEVFILHPNFLTGLELMPLVTTLFVGVIYWQIGKIRIFTVQRFFLLILFLHLLFSFAANYFFSGGIIGWVAGLSGCFLLLLLALQCRLVVAFPRSGWLLIVFNLLLLLLLQVDSHVLVVTGGHVSINMLNMIFEDQALLKKVAGYVGVDTHRVFIDLVLLLLLPWLSGILIGLDQKFPAKNEFRFGCLFAAFMLALVQFSWFEKIASSISLAEYLTFRMSSGELPLPLHPDLNQNTRLKKLLADTFLVDSSRCYRPHQIELSEIRFKKIVFLLAESLRADIFNLLMSRTKKFAATGKIFNQHFSSSNITTGSSYSFFHGYLPYKILFHEDRLPRITELERKAKEAGFEAVVFKPDFAGPTIRFGRIHEIQETQKMWQTTPRVLDETLKELNKPKRSIIISYLFNTHFNYYYPPEFEKFTPVSDESTNIFLIPPTPANIKKIANRYKNSVLYLDHCLNEFFNEVKKSGHDQDTLFVFLGDHGESLGEVGFLGHGTGADLKQFAVPLFVVGAGLDAETVNEPTSHLNALAEVLLGSGFNVVSPFSHLARKFPVLAFDESVAGRILVIQADYLNIFDISAGGRLRWIALLSRNFTLPPEIMEKWYADHDRLAGAVEADLAHILSVIGKTDKH